MGIGQKKENLGPVPSNKRPKIGETLMVGPSVASRNRQPLSNSNAAHASQPAAADPNGAAGAAGSDAIEFSSREDVERLLNEKMKGKNKNDYKVYFSTRCLGKFRSCEFLLFF